MPRSPSPVTATPPWLPTGSSWPGVGNFHACMAGLIAADGPRIIDQRLSGGRPVLGVCVGMQVMFEGSSEPSATPLAGVGEWPGTVERLRAPVVPHMGWSAVEVAPGSVLFECIADEQSTLRALLRRPHLGPRGGLRTGRSRQWHPASRGRPTASGSVAAVENGPLTATQFHPEKSGEAGLALLRNWVRSF